MSRISIPRSWLLATVGLEILCVLLLHYFFGDFSPWWALGIFLIGLFLAHVIYFAYTGGKRAVKRDNGN